MKFIEEARIAIGTSIYALAVSPDGSQVVVTSFDQKLRAYETATMKHLKTVHLATSFPHPACYAPDGTRVVSGSKSLTAFDTTTWKKGAAFKGHKHEIQDATFSPDGARLYTASGNGYTPADWSVRAWDAASGEQLWRWKGPDQLHAVAASPDGALVVSGDCLGNVTLHDAATGDARRAVNVAEWVDQARFTPDGAAVIFSGDFAGLFSMRVSDGALRSIATDTVRGAFALLSDGARAAVGGDDANGAPVLRVIDLATGETVAQSAALGGYVRAAASAPDGRRVYVTLGDVDELVVMSLG